MQKHLLNLSFIAIAWLLITGCKKDKDPAPPAKTKTELLTQAPWKFSTATVSGIDASGYLAACEKDNIYTFAANGTGTIDEGTSKCDAGDPQTNSFTWNWQSNETILQISTPLFSGGSNNVNLITLNETTLSGSISYPPYGNIVATFVHP